MKRTKQKLRIGELLVRERLIDEQQLNEALEMQKKRGGKIVQNLILLQYLDRSTFLRFLSSQPGVASIDLMNYTIPKDVIDLVPGSFAVENEIFPIDKMGSYLTVAMACPLDDKSVNALVELTKLKVQALLVSMEDIESALDRYYPEARAEKTGREAPKERPSVSLSDLSGLGMALPKVETAMTLDGVLNLIRTLKSLPALPDTVNKIREAVENPDTLTQDVVKIIERDPALSAKTISLANSAAYAIRHKVDNVLMAATMLGLREIYSLVLSSAVIDHFDNAPNFDYKAHWQRSMYCGTAAKIIRQACGEHGSSTIFAAGLLHDLGQLVLAELMPKRYAGIDLSLGDDKIISAESKTFGIAHPEVGFALAVEWGLPDEISVPIRFHHAPGIATDHKVLIATIALAASMADEYAGRREAGALDEAGEDALAMLGLEAAQLKDILEETGEAISGAA